MVKQILGEIERRARLDAENTLTNEYTPSLGERAARIQAQNDLNALDGYFQSASATPRERIYGYTGLAVGLRNGEITLAEWKSGLVNLCKIRAGVNGGASKSCDAAIGRESYLPNPCNPVTGASTQVQEPYNPQSAPVATNRPITDENSQDRTQFLKWLYGGWVNIRPYYGKGGQLSEQNINSIVRIAEQSFYNISTALCRGVKGGAGLSLGVSGEVGAFGYGSAVSGSLSVGVVRDGNTIQLIGFDSYGVVSGNFAGKSGETFLSAVEPTVPGLKPSINGASFSFGPSAWVTDGGSFSDLSGAFDSTSVTFGIAKGGSNGSFSTSNAASVGSVGVPISRVPNVTIGISQSSYATITPEAHLELTLASSWCK